MYAPKNITVKDLKKELKSRGLKVSGRKMELIERLEKDDENQKLNPVKNQLEKRKVNELKAILRQANLPIYGTKDKLIQQLIKNKVFHKNTLVKYGFKPTIYKRRKIMPLKSQKQTKLNEYKN